MMRRKRMKNRMLNIRLRICGQGKQDDEETMLKDAFALKFWKANLKGSIVGGFQSGCSSGPCVSNHFEESDNYFISRPISGGMVVTAMHTAIQSS